MISHIHSRYSVSISELKKQPMALVKEAHGEALAVLNHNEPVFYCVPKDLYEEMLEELDNAYLLKLVQKREGEEAIEVSIDDL